MADNTDGATVHVAKILSKAGLDNAKETNGLVDETESNFMKLNTFLSETNTPTDNIDDCKQSFINVKWSSKTVSSEIKIRIYSYIKELKGISEVADGDVSSVKEDLTASFEKAEEKSKSPTTVLNSFTGLQLKLSSEEVSSKFGPIEFSDLESKKSEKIDTESQIAILKKDIEKLNYSLLHPPVAPPSTDPPTSSTGRTSASTTPRSSLFGGGKDKKAKEEEEKKLAEQKRKEEIRKQIAEKESEKKKLEDKAASLEKDISRLEAKQTAETTYQTVLADVKKITANLNVFKGFYELFPKDHETIIDLLAKDVQAADDFAAELIKALNKIAKFCDVYGAGQ